MTQPQDALTLAEQTTRRLILAGIQQDDPGLQAIREWNTSVFERAGLPNPHQPPENPDAT